MPSINLTDTYVRTLDATDQRQEINDMGTECLMLLVQPERVDGKPSAKTFVWRGRIEGKVKKIKIGVFPMKVADARRAAQKLTNKVRAGDNPHEAIVLRKRVSAMPVVTVEAAFARYMEGQQIKTAGTKRRIFNYDVKTVLGSKAIKSVTKEDLAGLVNAKAETAKIAANRLHSLLSHFFKWAASSRSDWLAGETNPMAMVEKPTKTPKPRKRKLSEDEVRWFLTTCREFQREQRERGKKARATPRWAHALELLLRTGQRKTDITELADHEIEGGEIIRLNGARHKSGEEHVIYLTAQCRALLKAVPRPDRSARVFQRLGCDDDNVNRFRDRMGELAAQEGKTVEHWTIHDLRRTFGTTLQNMVDADERSVAGLDEIKKIIGHTLQGAAAAYLQGDQIPLKRRVMRVWNDYLDGLLEPVTLKVAA